MSKWDTTEGGALPGSDGPIEVEITGCSFNYDAAYNNGETLVFILEGECDHELWQDTILYSISNGWDTDDNVTVEGRDNFNGSTNYARFFQAVLDTKAKDIVEERAEASGEGPADSSIYEGLTFKFERKSYKVNFSGETETRYLLLPVKFVGEAGGKKKGKKKGKSKGKAGKASAKDLRKKLVKLAGKYDDHDDFVEAALDKYPEVEDMEDLYDEVLDEDEIFEDAQ